MRNLSWLVFAASILATPVFAQQNAPAANGPPDSTALLQMIRDLQDRVIALEGQIRQLKGQQTAAQSTPVSDSGAQAAAAAAQ